MNICRQRLIKVKSPLWQRSLANENAVVCRQGAMRWRLPTPGSLKYVYFVTYLSAAKGIINVFSARGQHLNSVKVA